MAICSTMPISKDLILTSIATPPAHREIVEAFAAQLPDGTAHR